MNDFEKSKLVDLIRFMAAQVCRVPYVYNNIYSINKAFREQISDSVELFDGSIKDFF